MAVTTRPICKWRLVEHVSLIGKKLRFFDKNFSYRLCALTRSLIFRLRNILNRIRVVKLSHECVIIVIKRYDVPIIFLKRKVLIIDFFAWIIELNIFLSFKWTDWFLILFLNAL